jgi:hypothetical protein
MVSLFLSITVTLALCAGLPTLGAAEEPCAVEHEKWSSASRDLNSALEEYRQIKDESVGPEISESLSKSSRSTPMARIVQSALKRRGAKLAEAGAKCRELADYERFAFDDLKRCASGPSQRRNQTVVTALSTIAKDRDRLLKHFQELMLDEAYVQYKGERDYPVGASSDYGQYQTPRMSYQRQWGPDPRGDRRWFEGYQNPQLPYGYYSR